MIVAKLRWRSHLQLPRNKCCIGVNGRTGLGEKHLGWGGEGNHTGHLFLSLTAPWKGLRVNEWPPSESTRRVLTSSNYDGHSGSIYQQAFQGALNCCQFCKKRKEKEMESEIKVSCFVKSLSKFYSTKVTLAAVMPCLRG